MFVKIDHVAVVVPDLDEAIKLYTECFGVEFYLRERNEDQGFEVAVFAVGESHFELLSPTRADSVISGFLKKRGPGIHHIGLGVQDIRTSIANVKTIGLQLINEIPRPGTDGSLISFIHPKNLFGTMIELVEPRKKDHIHSSGYE